MSEMSSSQLNEIWLTAMDALIYNRLSNLEYDRTIKATILKNKGNGIYQVEQEGVVKFDAQAIGDATYSISDEVYVLVPQGDYSSSKLIIGKSKLNSDDNLVNYITPFDTIVTTDNLVQNSETAFGIQANGENKGNKPLYVIKLSELGLEHNFMYNTLGLSADFKTLFSRITMASGNYGILLRLLMDDGNVYDAIFDSAEMFGDPYNYMTYFKQSKLFDLSKYETSIVEIGVYLYQSDNFTRWLNDEVVRYTPKFINNGTEPANDILLSNIQIILGDNLIPIADNTFSLTVVDNKDTSLSYTGNETKTIRATWYNKTDDNEFIGFSDGVVDNEYDEATYQAEYESEWSGAQSTDIDNVAPLRQSLQIYYDTNELHSVLTSLYKYTNQDLFTVITNLNNYLSKFDQTTYMNEDIATTMQSYINGFIDAIGENPEKDSWQQLYRDYLEQINNNYLILIEEETGELQSVALSDRLETEFNSLVSLWNTLQSQFSDWFTNLKAITDGADLNGDIRAYAQRQERIYLQAQKSVNKLYNELQTLYEANATHANELELRLENNDLIIFEEEYKEFVKQNANKYCIYWYMADVTASGDQWGGQGWSRIEWEFSPVPGMPTVDNTGLAYEKKSSILAEIQLDSTKVEEQVKAVLIYNHTPYESNILTFTNNNPPSESDIAQPEDTITILHGKNSQDSFQKYSSIFTLINAADSVLNRELKIQYNSIDENITSLDALKNTTIYWYIPAQASMLSYNADRLKELGFTKLSSLLLALQKEAEAADDLAYYNAYIRPGYECFFKEILSESDITFYYLIQNLYQQSANMNTIYCLLEKNDTVFETSIAFTFSTYGTSGTQYTLSIVPVGVQSAVEYHSGVTKPLYVEVSFTGYEGAKIENPPAIDMNYVLGTSESDWTVNFDGPLKANELAAAGITPRDGAAYYELVRKVDFDKCLYNVLQAQVTWGNIDDKTEANELLSLKSYYPVAQTIGPYYLDGPTAVVYDSLGTNPNYIHKPYKLFYTNNNAQITENISWEIRHYNQEGQRVTDLTSIAHYLPALHYQESVIYSYPEVGYYLRPLSMYVQNINIYSVVVALINGVPVYAQPIHITQNRWESSLLNSWNEDLTIDKENGIILSTMIGAGFKDSENAFNGVLMGDTGSRANIQNIGLYGFNAGAQSFGFDINGKAFIGKEGRGRIEFDGNNGTIYSAMRENNSGMKIDVDDGIIDILGPNKKGRVYLSIDGSSSSPYFLLKSTNGKTLMEVSDSNYYLQTEDFSTSNYTGVKLDLKDKKLTAGTFTIKANNGTNFITIDSAASTYPLSIGTSVDGANFRVKWDGTMQATNGEFEGRIESEEGEIGGWTLSANGLVSTKYGGNIRLYSQCPEDKEIGNSGLKNDWRILVGSYFGVDKLGNMWATSGTFTGSISSSSITSSTITIGDNFKVTSDGTLTANNGNFTGTITASSITNGTKFSVTSDGVLNASGATFSGTINASSITNGDKFNVTTDGVLSAKQGTIGRIPIGAYTWKNGQWETNDYLLDNGIVAVNLTVPLSGDNYTDPDGNSYTIYAVSISGSGIEFYTDKTYGGYTSFPWHTIWRTLDKVFILWQEYEK